VRNSGFDKLNQRLSDYGPAGGACSPGASIVGSPPGVPVVSAPGAQIGMVVSSGVGQETPTVGVMLTDVCKATADAAKAKPISVTTTRIKMIVRLRVFMLC
jgi:hypothetical protein